MTTLPGLSPGSTDPTQWLLPVLFPLPHLLPVTKRNLAPAQATVPREAPIREDFDDLWGDLLPPYPRSFHCPLVFYTAPIMQ